MFDHRARMTCADVIMAAEDVSMTLFSLFLKSTRTCVPSFSLLNFHSRRRHKLRLRGRRVDIGRFSHTSHDVRARRKCSRVFVNFFTANSAFGSSTWASRQRLISDRARVENASFRTSICINCWFQFSTLRETPSSMY